MGWREANFPCCQVAFVTKGRVESAGRLGGGSDVWALGWPLSDVPPTPLSPANLRILANDGKQG